MNVDVKNKASPTKLTRNHVQGLKKLSVLNTKKVCPEDGCNNNVDNSPRSSRWSCSGDTSLVEPEILEEMGVSMLDDEEVNYKSPRNECTQQPVLSLHTTEELRKSLAKEKSNFPKDDISRGSSFETVNNDRDGFELDEIESSPNLQLESAKRKMCINDDSPANDFCIFRRRRKPSAVEGVDEFVKLSDEMILMILKWLPKKCLVRSMSVCKRWYRIAQDEALWTRLDLGSKVLNDGALGNIVPRGLQILRLAQTEIISPIFQCNSEALVENFNSKLQFLDLSMAVVSAQDLAVLLATCQQLKKLSLEKCTLDKACCDAIARNRKIEVLNLTMCEGLDTSCIKSIIQLKRLTELNIAWCNLEADAVTRLCTCLPSTITRLNLSGCRKTISDNNVQDLVKHCADLIELDLSEGTMLTVSSAQHIFNLTKLEHLSLSRCYNIPTAMLLRLTYMSHLRFLDVFGLMSEPTFKTFMYNAGNTEINKYRFSAIARPTVGIRRTSIWGLRVRD